MATTAHAVLTNESRKRLGDFFDVRLVQVSPTRLASLPQLPPPLCLSMFKASFSFCLGGCFVVVLKHV